MNYFKLKYIFIISVFATSFGCKKHVEINGTASLTIVNALVGSNQLVTNFSNVYELPNSYKNSLKISYGSFNSDHQFGAYSGETFLKLYNYPDTLQHDRMIYNLKFNLPLGAIRTLFLVGSIGDADTLLTNDQPPYHLNEDSTFGVRVVNLSPGSNPVNVTLSTSPSVNEFISIGYKAVSSFKSYPATSTISSYVFEIRDIINNSILGSFTMSGINNGSGVNTARNNFRYKNFTLALIGLPGGSGSTAQRLMVINNF